MVEAEFEALAPAVERTRCPPKITRWHEGDRARLGDLSTASITYLESDVHIPRVLFVLQARAEKVNGLVDERMMGIRVEFSSLGAHRFDQTIRFLPGQSVTNVFTAKDWMGSSLFVKDVPPIPIEHETRGPNSHQVPHDLPKQWFRHVGRESDIPEEPLPSALERA
jgi:hypothetical protein